MAFVVGWSGVILKTMDGGRSWAAQNSGTTANLWDVKLLDDARAWIACETLGLLHTSNGGETWNAVSPASNFRKLFFLDPIHAWATSNMWQGILYSTINGGASWTDISLN